MKQIKKDFIDKSGHDLAQVCAQTGLDTKAEDVVILDVRGLTTFTEYFVVMNGKSSRHVQALAEAIERKLRSKRVKSSTAEGLQEGMWVLLDFDDVVVHIFYNEQRQFYDIEGLWSEAKQLEVEAA
ncbi:MAG: ribosome silencing factor [Desulfotalea sp.]|nr:MAG: ribosome silencing factor [Desulfotalea sp.]